MKTKTQRNSNFIKIPYSVLFAKDLTDKQKITFVKIVEKNEIKAKEIADFLYGSHDHSKEINVIKDISILVKKGYLKKKGKSKYEVKEEDKRVNIPKSYLYNEKLNWKDKIFGIQLFALRLKDNYLPKKTIISEKLNISQYTLSRKLKTFLDRELIKVESEGIRLLTDNLFEKRKDITLILDEIGNILSDVNISKLKELKEKHNTNGAIVIYV
ncbi:hypothetical protein ACT29H_02650 [Thermophagus sp. OGC60D27]|uniref:hypothetical protein n=1 Tax=Thermophagus sp. OGC60D27 TaxID=3458415 RepID=UPI004037B344